MKPIAERNKTFHQIELPACLALSFVSFSREFNTLVKDEHINTSYYFRLGLFYLSLLLSKISNLISLNKTSHIDILVYDRGELCTLESLLDFLTSFSDPHIRKDHHLIRQIPDFIDKGLTPIKKEWHKMSKGDTNYTWTELAFMHSQEALIISEEQEYGLNLIILETYLASLKSLNKYLHMNNK
jgi:hypothetical protein